MNSIRPVLDLIELTVLRFLRDTSLPMSPVLPRLVVRINTLEQRRA